jgi:hypothetical protein
MSPLVKRAARHSTAVQNELHCARWNWKGCGGENLSSSSSRCLQSSIFYNSGSLDRLQYLRSVQAATEIAIKIEKLRGIAQFLALLWKKALSLHPINWAKERSITRKPFSKTVNTDGFKSIRSHVRRNEQYPGRTGITKHARLVSQRHCIGANLPINPTRSITGPMRCKWNAQPPEWRKSPSIYMQDPLLGFCWKRNQRCILNKYTYLCTAA